MADFDCNNIRELLFKEGKSILDSAVNALKNSRYRYKSLIKEGRPADVIMELAKQEKTQEGLKTLEGFMYKAKILIY